MKQSKDYTLLALFIPFMFALVASGAFSGCNESEAKPIECQYEGRECPNYTNCKGHSLRDYQLDLHMDTVRVYDGERLVDTYITNWTNQIDTVILKDNE